MSKSVVRSVKNVTKGYSSVQVKVRNATSNDAWGPTGTDMSDIAQLTFSNSTDFYEIMDMLDKRLNDKGKNWRHVLKSLKVLDYCLHEGSETTVTWARKNVYIIKTLREFQYVDEGGRDVGLNVRTSAKELTALILDEERLRAERSDRKLWKSRVTGLEDFGPPPGQPSESSRPHRQERRQREDEDDLEYRLAVEASKNEAEEDRKRRERASGPSTGPDDDLARAIKLSKEEEELRRKELEQANAASLFDDIPVQQPQATGWNQGYQQQGAVDWFGNPVEQQQQQQPQSTGYLNNLYSQPAQQQQTGFQNGYGYNAFQPQQTGFDQSQQQYLQPQQTAFDNSNPYGQNGFQAQQTASAGTNNPWASNNEQASLAPQPTGSNNPFASSFTQPKPQAAARAPTLNTLQEQKTATQFNSYTAPASAPPKETDPYASRLNALLASGEGLDTFGNQGNLRIPAQHTAPGTFVNSAGTTLSRLQPNQTGANPFIRNQFTGNPSAHPQVPAQTGPGGFGGGGYGAANPFGAQYTGIQGQQPYGQPQQQQRPGQGGSLIDI